MMTAVGGRALRVTMTHVTGPVLAAHPVYLAPLARQIATTYNEGDDQSVGAWSTITKGNDATTPRVLALRRHPGLLLTLRHLLIRPPQVL
jgi:hypothetical protein